MYIHQLFNLTVCIFKLYLCLHKWARSWLPAKIWFSAKLSHSYPNLRCKLCFKIDKPHPLLWEILKVRTSVGRGSQWPYATQCGVTRRPVIHSSSHHPQKQWWGWFKTTGESIMTTELDSFGNQSGISFQFIEINKKEFWLVTTGNSINFVVFSFFQLSWINTSMGWSCHQLCSTLNSKKYYYTV